MWFASETEAYPSGARCANSDFAVLVAIEKVYPQITQITQIKEQERI